MNNAPRKPPGYHVMLSEPELIALGTITYQWAALDELLATISLYCSEYHKAPLGPGFTSNMFNQRREAFRLLILGIDDMPAKVCKKALSIDGRIAKAAVKRDELMHGVAYRGGQLGGIVFTRQMPPRTIFHHSSLDELAAFADELSLINGELCTFMDIWCH